MKSKQWKCLFGIAVIILAMMTACRDSSSSRLNGDDDDDDDDNAAVTGTYRNLFKEWGKTDTEIDAKVNNAWDKLFNGSETEKIYYTVGSDMAYILDTGNNDVRSEGMSYGMMMCVQLDKKTEFDRLWKWALEYMYNPPDKAGSNGKNNRGYFSWQVGTNGNKIDAGVAPDGEAYFVTALLFAQNRWGNGTGIYEYGKYARQVMYDMLRRQDKRTDNNALDGYDWVPMMNKQYKMTVFTTEGSNHHTDPSYQLPAFYECMAIEIENDAQYHNVIWANKAEALEDAQFWKDAAQASRDFFPTTVNATTGLGPDYANFNGSPTGGDHADFRFDAWRIAMNIAVDYAWWAADPWQVEFADKIQAFFNSKGIQTYGNQWKLDGSPAWSGGGNGDHSPGLVACNAVASLAASADIADDFLENFWNISMTSGQYRYYDGCLYMLGLLHCSGKFKAYFSGDTTPSPNKNSSISPAAATFDKRADLQKDITVTMTLNGNTLKSIQNGITNLSSGTHYTVNNNVVTLKKEYLAMQSNGATTLTFVFSAGENKTIAITIKETAEGGGGSGDADTKYTFDTDLPDGYPKYIGTNGSISAVRKTAGSDNVLEVTVSQAYQNSGIVLPFDLDGKTLSNYSKLYIEIAGVSGSDLNNKQYRAEVSNSGTVTNGLGSNTQIAITNNINLTPGTWHKLELSLSNVPSGLTGVVEIAFGIASTPIMTYQINVLELVE